MKTIFITPLYFDAENRQLYASSDHRYLIDVNGTVCDITTGKPDEPIKEPYIITELSLQHLEQACVRSLYWLSHTPEDRGKREIIGETCALLADLAEMYAAANGNDTTETFKRYAAKYSNLLASFYASRSNTASSFITGGSNFPVRRQEKLHRWADNKAEYLNEWRSRAKKAIIKGWKPKKTVESELERYRRELAASQKQLEIFKAIKKILRSKKLGQVQKIEQLMALGLSENTALETFNNGLEWYVIPYKSRDIKRLEQMVAKYETRVQDAETGEKSKDYEYKGIRVVHNVATDRLQLFFDGKPSDEVRQQLKKAAFRWSPSNGCWQGYLNQWQCDKAKRIIDSMTATI